MKKKRFNFLTKNKARIFTLESFFKQREPETVVPFLIKDFMTKEIRFEHVTYH